MSTEAVEERGHFTRFFEERIADRPDLAQRIAAAGEAETDVVKSSDGLAKAVIACYPTGVQVIHAFSRDASSENWKLKGVWHRELHPTRAMTRLRGELRDRMEKRVKERSRRNRPGAGGGRHA